jgi:transposase
MQLLYPHCAGLDVHKDSIFACVRHLGDDGKARDTVRSFPTTSRGLLTLGDWLAAEGVTDAAMESTGVYWKPVWNLLEDRVKLMLVNAQHIKQVSGRKTDVKDSQWIAQLLQHGLLKPSFVPDRPQRQLRDLTRQRAQLTGDMARVANRIQQVLEDANIKLGSVASDVLGASGRDMLQALIAGTADPATIAQLARGRMRPKIPLLTEALTGRVNDHHRFMLKMLLEQVEQLEKQIEAFDKRIEEVMGPFEKAAVKRLDGIPGIDPRSAQNILAEIGLDMSRFPTDDHLASWTGICPGNHQSAGKRRSGRITHGNRWLKRTLAQCALAASRKNGSFLQARFRRLGAKRGRKRAVIAVAHSQLMAIHGMLKNSTDYHDLGANYLDELQRDRVKKHLVRRLTGMGFEVKLFERPPKEAA